MCLLVNSVNVLKRENRREKINEPLLKKSIFAHVCEIRLLKVCSLYIHDTLLVTKYEVRRTKEAHV